jgi:hypothetical protein
VVRGRRLTTDIELRGRRLSDADLRMAAFDGAVAPTPQRLREWYIERVQELQQRGARSSSAEVDLRAAQDRFGVGCVTQKAIRELRVKLAPADWKKRGRRKAVKKGDGQ